MNKNIHWNNFKYFITDKTTKKHYPPRSTGPNFSAFPSTFYRFPTKKRKHFSQIASALHGTGPQKWLAFTLLTTTTKMRLAFTLLTTTTQKWLAFTLLTTTTQKWLAIICTGKLARPRETFGPCAWPLTVYVNAKRTQNSTEQGLFVWTVIGPLEYGRLSCMILERVFKHFTLKVHC